MKNLKTQLAVLLLSTLCSFTGAYAGSTPSADVPTLKEASPVQSYAAVSGPIVHNWTLKSVDGTLNIVVNEDGTWVFSGSGQKKEPGKDFDITLALKSNLGAVILFEYAGDASNGIQFSKEGQSNILKDNFASFAANHKTAWEYRLPLNSEGRAKLYEAREKKKEELKKEEEEAKKRHDEKVAAEKKEELKKEEQRELAEDRAAQQQHSSGSSVVGDIVSAANTVGTVVNAVGSVVSDVMSFF
jgi:hypothetical protein